MSGDGIGPQEARDHLEMAERIIAETSQRLCYGAEYFIVWGLFSGLATLNYQLIGDRVLPVSALSATVVLFVAAIAFTFVRGRALRSSVARRSLLQREFLNVLWLSVGMAVIVNIVGFNLFSGWAQSAIWTVVESIVLFFIAIHGNRRAAIGGVVMLASLAIANFIPASIAGYVLAAGMILGYAGFGVAESLAGD